MVWRGKLSQLLVFSDYKGTGDRNENGHKVIWLNGVNLFHSWVEAVVLKWYGDRCNIDADTCGIWKHH